MPSGPPAPESFSHLLTKQEQDAEKAATTGGQSFDSRGKAVANVASRFDNPADALSYLSGISSNLDAEKQSILTSVGVGGSLSTDQQRRVAEIEGQLSGTQSLNTDVVRGIQQSQADRLRQYRGQEVEALKGTVEDLRFTSSQADRALREAETVYATDPDRDKKLKPFQVPKKSADARLHEAESVFAEKQRVAAEAEARTKAEAATQEAATEQTKAEARRTLLRDQPIEKLGDTVEDLREVKDRLQTELTNARALDPTSDRVKALQTELDKANNQYNEANSLYEKRVQAGEEPTARRQLRTNQEQARREVASVADLQVSISTMEMVDIPGLEGQLQYWENAVRTATTPQARRDAERQRDSFTRELTDARGNLKAERGALKAAQDKARKESGIHDTMTLENLKQMTPEEFGALPEADQKKFLYEAGKAVIYNQADYTRVRRLMERGQRVSVEEMAIFVRETTARMIDHGGGGYPLGALRRLEALYPEVAHSIMEKVTSNDTFQDQLRERFPNGWQRMLDFARNHPGWLMILLAIMAGTAGAAAVAAGPAAGLGTGLGALAGGGFAVSRRN